MDSLAYNSVDENVFTLYDASYIAKTVMNESNRKLKAEDMSWSTRNAKSLTNLVLECIAFNFELFTEYFQSDKITEKYKSKLMHLIPTNLPLALSSSIIPEGVYWKRACYDAWSMGKFMMQFEDSWKRLYMEKFLQFFLEDVYPNTVNLVELKKLLQMLNHYVLSLRIEQLIPYDFEEDNRDDEIKHIDLHFILSSLTNLQNFSLTCGIKNCSTEFSRNLFEFSVTDCVNIGKGLQETQNLRSYRMYRCHLNATKLRCILTNWQMLPCLKIVEFMSCGLGDDCLLIMIEVLSKLPLLEELSLVNNNISSEGAVTLSSSLEALKSLKILNLRLNFIQDEGGAAILAALSKHDSIEKLNLEGCELGSAAADKLCQLIVINNRVLEIDLSINHLHTENDEAILEAVNANSVLQRLDLRMNKISPDLLKIMSEKLIRNRNKKMLFK